MNDKFTSYRCGHCEGHPPFLNKQALLDHMIEAHPESNLAERANEGFRVVPLFGPGFSPVVSLVNGEDAICSMSAVEGMRIGYHMLMYSRQIADDWYLVRIFEEEGLTEDQALNILRSLRARRSGQGSQPNNSDGNND